jgi:hypothetical protein
LRIAELNRAIELYERLAGELLQAAS